jgi:hypothetical protein
MSGGHFDYLQYRIAEIADSVEQLIVQNGTKKEYSTESWENKYYDEYPLEVIEKFREGLDYLRRAQIYAQRIDWLVSGDDGVESFFRRLENDLNNLENSQKF